MDSHLYVDQYLRRRKGAAFPSGSVQQQQLSAAAHNAILSAANLRSGAQAGTVFGGASSAPVAAPQAATGIDPHAISRTLSEHATVVKDLASHVQTFVERTDGLNLQVQTMEDKLLNLTKMMKMAQDSSEDGLHTLAEQLEALRRRVDGLEEKDVRRREEIDAVRAWVPKVVEDAVQSVVGKLEQRVVAEIAGVKTTVSELERQTLIVKAEMPSKQYVAKAIDEEAQRTLRILRDSEAKQASDLGGLKSEMTTRVLHIEKELTSREHITVDQVKRIADDRAAASITPVHQMFVQELREAMSSVQTAVRDETSKSFDRVEEDMKGALNRIRGVEQQSTDIEASVQAFITAFKEHTSTQAAKMDDTAAGMKELAEMHDETRNVVASEIESTKQWATRNMMRLKKHLDNVNVDVSALKDAHKDLHVLVERLKATQHDEHLRLADLIAQRSKEAEALSEMVDREISSVHNIARAYRTTPHSGEHTVGGAALAGGSGSSGPEAMGPSRRTGRTATAAVVDDEGTTDDGGDSGALGRFANDTAARRQRMHKMFGELTFRERNTAPLTQSHSREASD